MNGIEQGFLLIGLVAESVDAEFGAGRVENPHHDFLALQGGQRADPEIDRARLGQHELHAAILRNALFRDVHAGNDLDARGDLVLDGERRLRDFLQHPVNAVADAVKLLVRFEMQVGGAGVDGIEQDFLDVFDDRRIVDFGTGRFRFLGLGIALDVEVQVVADIQSAEAGVAFFQNLFDPFAELVVFHHYR